MTPSHQNNPNQMGVISIKTGSHEGKPGPDLFSLAGRSEVISALPLTTAAAGLVVLRRADLVCFY